MSRNVTYINISERKLLLRIVDVILVVFGVWVLNYYFDINYISFAKENVMYWLLLLSVYFVLFGEIFQLYDFDVSNNRYLVFRSILLTTVATTFFYVLTPYLTPVLPKNRIQILYFFIGITVPVVFWRFFYQFIFFSPKYFKRILILGHSSKIEKILKLTKNDGFHDVAAYVSDNKIENFTNFKNIEDIDLTTFVRDNFISEILISTDNFDDRLKQRINKKIILLFEEGYNIKSFERFYEQVTDRIPEEYLNFDFYKNFNFSKNSYNRLYLFSHRFLDVLISFIGSLGFLFVLPIVFIGNLFANRGPIFYTQERVGKGGKTFKIYKLRSMVTNAEKDGAVWATKNDSRITLFGKFLRNTRLDEVPQFFNILKGDMSLIGPRPERPQFVSDLEKQVPFYAIRHVIRPGLTGWAQVNYPYANTIEEQKTKLTFDLYYIKERSLLMDLKIIIKTLTTVLFFRGQ